MRAITKRCKSFVCGTSALILTLLIGVGPASAQEDMNKLPTDVKEALEVIANYIGKGGITIVDFTTFNGNVISHDMWTDGNLVEEVPIGEQQINAMVKTLNTSVDMTVTISASPDCELRVRNGRPYWYPRPPCPQ
jgi:hypothetical protein